MRLLSAFLMGVLVVGAVHVASAETTCVVDAFAADDSFVDEWALGSVPSTGVDVHGSECFPGGQTSPGGVASNCGNEYQRQYDTCRKVFLEAVGPWVIFLEQWCQPGVYGIWTAECKPHFLQWQEFYMAKHQEMNQCFHKAQAEKDRCLNKKSARLPQKTCRANAKHGKQARAGFKQTQRGCPAKAPTKASKSKVKAPKLTQTKAIKR